MNLRPTDAGRPHVVVVGAGFAGLAVVKALKKAEVDVTLVDRTNYNVFQPLLFQVATAMLSPNDIAVPIRSLFRKQRNVRVLMGEVIDLDLSRRVVRVGDATELTYDTLVVATGARTSYYGEDAAWSPHARGLKTLPAAQAMRSKLLAAFERAEMQGGGDADADGLLTFVVVGGGPTGVASTGMISELARGTLARDFRSLDPGRARVILVEAGARLLSGFSQEQSDYAHRALEGAGVEVRLGSPVAEVRKGGVRVGADWIASQTVVWSAGTEGTPLLARLGVPLTKRRTVEVGPDLTVPGHADCFVIGDAAHSLDEREKPLPGLATVAKQQGRYVGQIIAARIKGKPVSTAFAYRDPGSVATITRRKGVAAIGPARLKGFLAWLLWGLIHLVTLSGGQARASVLANWAVGLATYRRNSRLIIEEG